MSDLGYRFTLLVIGHDPIEHPREFRIGNLRRLTHILYNESKTTLKHSIVALTQPF
jgi:hypothetical protein